MAKYDLGTTPGQMRQFAAAVVEGAAAGREGFEFDDMTRVWIEYHLLMLGEAANRIRADLEVAAPSVPCAAVVGLRNVIVHGYDRVKRERVWATAVDDVPALLQIVEALLAAGRG